MGTQLVFCNCPDLETAKKIARALIEEHLAACINCVPGLLSVYRWQDQIEEQAEVLLLIKTSQTRFQALKARILALHPYELPEIVAVDVSAGHPPYLDWVNSETYAQR